MWHRERIALPDAAPQLRRLRREGDTMTRKTAAKTVVAAERDDEQQTKDMAILALSPTYNAAAVAAAIADSTYGEVDPTAVAGARGQ